MNIEFTKDISDLKRFTEYLKQQYSIIESVLYSDSTNSGSVVVPDSTDTTTKTSIINYIADYSNSLSTEEQSILYVDGVLKDAYTFGQDIKRDFINENVRLGITSLGKTKYVRTTMREVNESVDTISLKDAIDECQIIIDDLNNPDGVLDKSCPFINITRITDFMNKMKVYCGIPIA